MNYLLGENTDGTQKWEKCRLALVKTVGGYMLEFYSPPKSLKPKSGVFCFLITEARETSALEMPDHENTFVLKVRYTTSVTPILGFNLIEAIMNNCRILFIMLDNFENSLSLSLS